MSYIRWTPSRWTFSWQSCMVSTLQYTNWRWNYVTILHHGFTLYDIEDTQQNVGDLALKFLTDDEKASASSQVLFEYSPHPLQQQFCGMHLVAYFGLNDISSMVRLLKEKVPDAKDSQGRTPLSYAKNVQLVELLLNYNKCWPKLQMRRGVDTILPCYRGRRCGSCKGFTCWRSKKKQGIWSRKDIQPHVNRIRLSLTLCFTIAGQPTHPNRSMLELTANTILLYYYRM